MEKVKYEVRKFQFHDEMYVGWKPAHIRDVLVEDGHLNKFVIVKIVNDYEEEKLISIFPSHKEGEYCHPITDVIAVFSMMEIPEEWIKKLL